MALNLAQVQAEEKCGRPKGYILYSDPSNASLLSDDPNTGASNLRLTRSKMSQMRELDKAIYLEQQEWLRSESRSLCEELTLVCQHARNKSMCGDGDPADRGPFLGVWGRYEDFWIAMSLRFIFEMLALIRETSSHLVCAVQLPCIHSA